MSKKSILFYIDIETYNKVKQNLDGRTVAGYLRKLIKKDLELETIFRNNETTNN